MEIIPFTIPFESIEEIQTFYLVLGFGLDSLKERIRRDANDVDGREEAIDKACDFHYARLRELLLKRNAKEDYWDWVKK